MTPQQGGRISVSFKGPNLRLLFLELQTKKTPSGGKCPALSKEVPGHCPKQLTHTLVENTLFAIILDDSKRLIELI